MEEGRLSSCWVNKSMGIKSDRQGGEEEGLRAGVTGCEMRDELVGEVSGSWLYIVRRCRGVLPV